MTYYIKGGSRFNEANPKVWVLLNILGYNDDKYLDQDWKDIDYDFGGAGAIVDTLDPFWRLGGATGGEKEVMIGLWDDWRLRITEAGGLMQWNPDVSEWQALGGGAAGDIFKTINCPAGTDPVADAVDDTLNLTSGNNRLTITGNAGTDTVEYTVVEGNIDHDALNNYDADKHVAHSGVTITAGVGLSGGGTIAANRTIDCDITQYTDVMAQAVSINNVVEDLTPQLGGNLDAMDKAISNIKSIAFNDGDKTITEVKDEDNMASNSDTKICTQQSIKAYVDASGGDGGTKELVLDIMPYDWRTAGSSNCIWWNKNYGSIIQHGYSSSKLLINFVVPSDYKAGTNIVFSFWSYDATAGAANYWDIFEVLCEQISNNDAIVATANYNDYTLTDCVPTKSTTYNGQIWKKRTFTLVGSTFTMIPGNLILMRIRISWHYSRDPQSAGWRGVYTWE